MIRNLVNGLGFDVVRYPNRRGFEWRLSELLRFLRIDTVIDVGANRGQYAAASKDGLRRLDLLIRTGKNDLRLVVGTNGGRRTLARLQFRSW